MAVYDKRQNYRQYLRDEIDHWYNSFKYNLEVRRALGIRDNARGTLEIYALGVCHGLEKALEAERRR